MTMSLLSGTTGLTGSADATFVLEKEKRASDTAKLYVTGNLDEKNEKIVLDLFRQLHEQGTTIIVVTHDALVASCAQREIMLNHGVLIGEKWNDEAARQAYEAAGGKPASTGSTAEGAQTGETAIEFADPTKAAKTGATE